MNWSALEAIATAVTAGAAIAAAIIGYGELGKWRIERRAKIAGAALAHVYEMSEALRSARSSVILPYETAKREGLPDEIATNPNYIPEARLLGYQEFFGQFRSQKFVFVAEFGTEAAEPFDELWRIRKEIRWAVYVLLRHEKSIKEDEHVRAHWEEHRKIAFHPEGFAAKRGGLSREDDPLDRRISEAVSKIERTYREAMAEAKRPPWWRHGQGAPPAMN